MSLFEELNHLAELPVWEWPAESPEAVLAGLDANDSDLRVLAVELASELVDNEVADKLLSIVKTDDDELVASRAAIALGPALETCDIEGFDFDENGPPMSQRVFDRVLDELERVYRDAGRPTLVRRRALEGAVRAPREWQQSIVRAAYASGDRDWKMTAVFCMGYLDGFDDQIMDSLHDDSLELQVEAMRAAGRAGIQQAATTAMEIAKDTRAAREMRLAAIEALGTLSTRGSETLLKELSVHPDDEISDIARDSLALRGVGLADEFGEP